MAISNKMANEKLRNEWVENLIAGITAVEEEVLRVKSNEIAIPVIDANDEEKFVVITVKVPTGADKGKEPYDGYAEADDYAHKLAEKKIAHDKKMREEKK